MNGETTEHSQPIWIKLTVYCLVSALVVILVLLGNWQMRRLAWKNELVKAVETRAFGAPVAPPEGAVTLKDHAYSRVKLLAGQFLHNDTILVKAVTELGMGFWVMTPYKTQSTIIWTNRGFIPQRLKSSANWSEQQGGHPLIGLLRLSEPKGTWLERNRPEQNRWYSRDIAAFALKRRQNHVAAYFLDLEASHTNAGEAQTSWPRAGMTQLNFRNPHLAYALTWYAMALMLVCAIFYLGYNSRRKPKDTLI